MARNDTEVLFVVPPFAALDRAALGVHLLQAIAKREGVRSRVFYSNLRLATAIGRRTYNAICRMPVSWLVGERLFARLAYGVGALGHDHGLNLLREYSQIRDGNDSNLSSLPPLSQDVLLQLERMMRPWLVDSVNRIMAEQPAVVGLTTTFEQTAASIAIAGAVKSRRPETVVLLGGANCEQEMARGVSRLGRSVDFIFSGESEQTFSQFLRERPQPHGRPSILYGEPCKDMDALPTPCFDEFFDQYSDCFKSDGSGMESEICLPYETSRGCWWGEKKHCTFCGLNGLGMGFRRKSPDRVIDELKRIVQGRLGHKVAMTDNIMPHEYFSGLLPRMRRELPDLKVCYEQKSNLRLNQMKRLRDAGITEIQPGIEALSTGLLRLMKKGVSARQNIRTLRYGRSLGMQLHWNLLFGFPGDRVEYYQETMALLPLLRHVEPPSGLAPIVLSRFSPYFEYPDEYGIEDLEPMPAYRDVLPRSAEPHRVAYFFDGKFSSESRHATELRGALNREILEWQAGWRSSTGRPELRVVRQDGDTYRLIDTRLIKTDRPVNELITREQARAALATGNAHEPPAMLRWATEHGVVTQIDGKWEPLATADIDILEEFELQSTASSLGGESLSIVNKQASTARV